MISADRWRVSAAQSSSDQVRRILNSIRIPSKRHLKNDENQWRNDGNMMNRALIIKLCLLFRRVLSGELDWPLQLLPIRTRFTLGENDRINKDSPRFHPVDRCRSLKFLWTTFVK